MMIYPRPSKKCANYLASVRKWRTFACKLLGTRRLGSGLMFMSIGSPIGWVGFTQKPTLPKKPGSSWKNGSRNPIGDRSMRFWWVSDRQSAKQRLIVMNASCRTIVCARLLRSEGRNKPPHVFFVLLIVRSSVVQLFVF